MRKRKMRGKVALVDFDGTLIGVDSLRTVMIKERWWVSPQVFVPAGQIVMCGKNKRKQLPYRDRLKIELVKRWMELSKEQQEEYVEFFKKRLNGKLIEQLKRGNYSRVVIVSASEKGLIEDTIKGVLAVDGVIAVSKEGRVQTLWHERKMEAVKKVFNGTSQNLSLYTDSWDDEPLMQLCKKVYLVRGEEIERIK